MTVTYNTALVRYQGGHVYVNRSGSERQRELYIEMGGVKDRTVAIGIADQILSQYRAVRQTVADQGEVRTLDQVPTVGFDLGDLVGGDRLTGYSVALAGDGLVELTPQTGDRVQVRLEAINRQLQRAGSGMRSEYAAPNIVQPDTGGGTDTTPPEFSISDDVAETFSPAWRAVRPWWCAWLDCQLVTAGASPTVVQIARERVGGSFVVVGSATIGAGLTRGLAAINLGWNVGDRLVVGVKTAGSGAKDLTVTTRGVML